MTTRLSKLMVLWVLAFALAFSAHAKTLRVADQGDAASMDPHSVNEGLQLGLLSHIYEALVTRDQNFKLAPALATSWRQTAPTVWRFNLRKGVTFHDGTPFTAQDVMFSFDRAKADSADFKVYVSMVQRIQKIDDHTLDFVTFVPYPILPESLSLWLIMSKKWCQENHALYAADRRRGQENTASYKANGTGVFRLRERQPGVRTVLARSAHHWAPRQGNVEEVIFTPIASDSARVNALLSGQVDLIEPLPLQDVDRVKANPQLKVWQGLERRVIFLGMDQKRDELLYSNVKGKNPFKDKRVRQALYQAIDIQDIKNKVMQGTSNPVALMYTDNVRGFARDLNKRPLYDVETAKQLLTQAGYPDGFEVKLNCPTDRYVNDLEICKAIVQHLARIHVKVNLEAESRNIWLPKIFNRNTSFYMLGWTPPTNDALYVHYSLMSTPIEGTGFGLYNLGSYSNPVVDALNTSIATELDDRKRNSMIREAAKIHQDEVGHIPLHQQAFHWGSKSNISLIQLPSNAMHWEWVTIKQ